MNTNEYKIETNNHILRERMSIVRSQHDKENPYVMIRRDSAQDNRLSYEARGLLSFLLSQRDEWEFKLQDLMREGKCGRDKIYRILEELINVGYVQRFSKQQNKKGHWSQSKYEVYESPYTEKPYTENTEIKDQSNKEEKRIKDSTPKKTGVEIGHSDSVQQNQFTLNEIEHEDPSLARQSDSEKTPPPAPPSSTSPKKERPRNELFDAVAIHCWGMDPETLSHLDKSDATRIGMVAAWLGQKKDHVQRGRKRVEFGYISAPASPKHVEMFADYCKKQGFVVFDLEKFVDHWRRWANSLKMKNGVSNSHHPTESVPINDYGPTTFAWYLQPEYAHR